MYIKCWGSRGSVPVSGRQYVRYGGDTTCLEIRNQEQETIIVDAGTGLRRLGNRVVSEGRFGYHFIFTHAHWDHLMGFPYFKPLFRKEAVLYIHLCPFQDDFVRSMLSRMLAPPNFPVKYSELSARMHYEPACPEPFRIGSMTIVPMPISHPNGGSGYKFIENGKSFVFLTDNELGFHHPGGLGIEAYVRFCQDTELLIHDAEYTPAEYLTYAEWGHSTYTSALDLALAAGVRRLGLFHLNQDRSDDQVDAIADDCRRLVRQSGSRLECTAVGCETEFTV
jgi:phosphoribosyl 1,2-cyclic phosphodiesterase